MGMEQIWGISLIGSYTGTVVGLVNIYLLAPGLEVLKIYSPQGMSVLCLK